MSGKRDNPVSIRFTDRESDWLRKKSALEDVSIAEYVRGCITLASGVFDKHPILLRLLRLDDAIDADEKQ